MIVSGDPEAFAWRVIPGRTASHAIADGRGVCGQTSRYADTVLRDKPNARRCEQCLIRIVTGISCKAFRGWGALGLSDNLVKKRRAWREYRMGQVRS
jgi:hypothetical protein